MNQSQAHASMIDCSQGLGRLLPKACARRWKIANDVEAGDVGSTGHKCTGCPDGRGRANVVQLKPRAAKAVGRANGASDRDCRRCGGSYKPKSRNQFYCQRPECASARGREYAEQRNQKRRVRHTSAT